MPTLMIFLVSYTTATPKTTTHSELALLLQIKCVKAECWFGKQYFIWCDWVSIGSIKRKGGSHLGRWSEQLWWKLPLFTMYLNICCGVDCSRVMATSPGPQRGVGGSDLLPDHVIWQHDDCWRAKLLQFCDQLQNSVPVHHACTLVLDRVAWWNSHG